MSNDWELRLIKGQSRRGNFSPWDKGQCPHGTLSHAVPMEHCPTLSPWNIVPRCPRVLQVLPTMSDSSQVSQSQLSHIVGSTRNTLGQRGTMSLVPRSKVASSGRTLSQARSF